MLQVRAVKRHLVRDTVDDDAVRGSGVHRLATERDVLGDDTPIATNHFLDELGRERPLPTDDETHAHVHGPLPRPKCGFEAPVTRGYIF